MRERQFLALDLGAESGRLMAATLRDGEISLRELHRFPNIPIREAGSLRWNFRALISEVEEGLRKAAATGTKFESISTDSWGVDYVLFDESGEFIEPVYHYRDSRSKLGVERVFKAVSWKEIFEETGIQYMPINTIFQIGSEDLVRLKNAKFLLGVGDAVNHWLSGYSAIEVSMASTFQLYNPRSKDWSDKLIRSIGLPRELFPRIVTSGTRLGPIQPSLAHKVGLAPMEVIATCSHDTGTAVAGVPASGKGWAYLSSGTWSLMGVELDAPVINEQSRKLNFTNEIGFGDTVRLLKNLSGLWLIQECRREWAQAGRDFDYATLTKLAKDSPEFASLINPAAEEFLAPESMTAQMAAFCRRTGQQIPETEGAFVRSALESLALLYRRTLIQIEQLIAKKIERLHIVGGGSNNALLNQFTANALQIPVFAGPAEATALGNVLIQAIALGHIPNLEAGRSIVRSSTAVREFHPEDGNAWASAFERFQRLCGD